MCRYDPISSSVSVLTLALGANSASSSARSLACRVAQLYAVATLEQPRRFHPIRPGRECRRRTAPAQRLDLLKERRIGMQGREVLEEQCEIALFVQNVWRELLDRTVAIQKLGSGPGADSRDAGVAIGDIAHEREQV